MTQTLFGARTWNLDVLIDGTRTAEQFKADLEHFVNFLGMDTAGMAPADWSYPIPDGRGGQGETIMQPYVEPKLRVQSLTTSFAIVDSWPEWFSLTIKSCIQFSAEAVMSEIRRRFGGDSILDCHVWTLGVVVRNPRRPSRAFC